MSPQDPGLAAARIGCDVAVIAAVWEVEASGRAFLADGSLIRRFEPHHFPSGHWKRLGFAPGALAPWRASLKVPSRAREDMLGAAWSIDPEAAARATSWGGPQIMGFNHADAGHASAQAMVRAMADSEGAQLDAFVAFVMARRLDRHLRAHDWRAFTAGYNGTGQVDAYSRKIEAAYRRHSGGKASPTVLRLGDEGPAVRRLQTVLGVAVDGVFGPATLAAVEAFQAAQGLPVDGVVGQRTWAALQQQRDAAPAMQKTAVDVAIDRALDVTVKGGPGVGVGLTAQQAYQWVRDDAPAWVLTAGWGLALACVAALAALVLLRLWRRAA